MDTAERREPERAVPRELALTRWVRRLDRVALSVCGLAIGLMALHVIVDVVARNVLGRSLHDTLAFVSYLWMPIIAYLALGAAQLGREHMSVTLLVDHVGPRTRRVVETVADVLVAALLLYLTVLAWYAVQDSWYIDERVGLTRWLVLWPVKAVVTVGLALYCVSTVATVVERVLGRTEYAAELERAHDDAAVADA
jgi:TRAP-type C4-dicarboxylate transport system permease small subunit